MRLTNEARHDEQYFVVRVADGGWMLTVQKSVLACLQPHLETGPAT